MRQIEQDRVPTNLTECVNFIVSALEKHEIEDICTNKVGAIDVHMTFGMYLRNAWSLWDKEMPLNQWFRQNLTIGHADDISQIILEAVVARVKGVKYNPFESISEIHSHWQRYGCNEHGE